MEQLAKGTEMRPDSTTWPAWTTTRFFAHVGIAVTPTYLTGSYNKALHTNRSLAALYHHLPM